VFAHRAIESPQPKITVIGSPKRILTLFFLIITGERKNPEISHIIPSLDKMLSPINQTPTPTAERLAVVEYDKSRKLHIGSQEDIV
jgi:hypothetical protein